LAAKHIIVMKKLLWAAALVLPMLSQAQKSKSKGPASYDLVIGTYTTGKSEGIYVYRFYPENGRFAYLNKVTGVANPSYLCISPDNKFVYAVNEVGKAGEVSSFSFEPKSGQLTFMNKQASGGADPCYVSEDKGEKHIFVANYSSGAAAVLPVNKDGSLGPVAQLLQDQGHGINTDRQEKAHVHTTVLSPDEKYLLYTDLGTDKLNVMRYHASETQPLTPATPPYVTVTAGNGPRHLAFAPNHKYLYLVTEMGAVVYTYEYNNSHLKQVQSVSMLPDGFTGNGGAAADIHVSPDGRFLYASNRGDANEIVVYSINQETGMLTFVERKPSLGKSPRNFVIDPSGKFLLVANQNSDSIYEYKIDQNTGKLTLTNNRLEVGNPVCLKFAPVE
jgi:6-phosphogluconolactonase